MQWNLKFGTEKISWDAASQMIHAMPDVLLWAMPVMVILTLTELLVSWRSSHQRYDRTETLGTMGVGAGYALISIYVKLLLLFCLVSLYNAVPWRMSFNWLTLLPCYILFDFCSYWAHRISHQQRIWWATHVVHHSSEHLNLTVSFRLSWLEFFKIIFILPVALAGFHPVIIFIVNQASSLYQFWVHTEYIRKLPEPIEKIFVTPSSHRVHHGSQEKYINKNYGSTLIIWDKLFGTFQEEEERPRFGITANIASKANPFHINFHEYRDMFADVVQAPTWQQKLFYIFGDPTVVAQKRKELKRKADS